MFNIPDDSTAVKLFLKKFSAIFIFRSGRSPPAQKCLPGKKARETHARKLLGDLESARDGRCLIVAAQSHDRHNIAAGLSRGRRGARIRAPLAGEAGVQVVHRGLILDLFPVIAQRRTEVEVLHVRSGDLAVGEVLIPVELHTGVVLFHNECTHTEAGLVVLVVRDRVNGVDARLIRRTEGHADIVEQAGELIERLVELDERVDVDADLLEQEKAIKQKDADLFEQQEMLRRMVENLTKNGMDDATVMKMTGLTEEQIRKLK